MTKKEGIIKNILIILLIVLIIIGLFNIFPRISKAETACSLTIDKIKERGTVETDTDWDGDGYLDEVEYDYKAIIKISSNEPIKGIQFKLYHSNAVDIVSVDNTNTFFNGKNATNIDKGIFLYMQDSNNKNCSNSEVCTLHFNTHGKDDLDIGFNFETDDNFKSMIIKGDGETNFNANEISYPKRKSNSGSNNGENSGNNNSGNSGSNNGENSGNNNSGNSGSNNGENSGNNNSGNSGSNNGENSGNNNSGNSGSNNGENSGNNNSGNGGSNNGENSENNNSGNSGSNNEENRDNQTNKIPITENTIVVAVNDSNNISSEEKLENNNKFGDGDSERSNDFLVKKNKTNNTNENKVIAEEIPRTGENIFEMQFIYIILLLIVVIGILYLEIKKIKLK